MLSSWFGLEPIPICSIDRAPFSGPESRSGASLTDWTTGKIGIDPALGAHLRGLLAVLRRRLGGFPGLCGLLESFRRASASGWRWPRGAPGAPPRCGSWPRPRSG